jgi:hypothetical protein
MARGRLFRKNSFHETSQLMTDGAIARLYTIAEWTTLVSDLFEVKDVKILGSKAGLVPLPPGRPKKVLMSLIPNSLSQLLNNRMKFGTFLFSTLRKSN